MQSSNQGKIDQLYMEECLSLAQKGAGYVSPNPMVGAVIVKNNKVIGRGFHRKFGGAHAEVNAIHNANGSLKGATLYVNLEPCNHFGKTPPCTDLIIKEKLSRVVIGAKDVNPDVAGRGISKLRQAGIKVELGILKEGCNKLNEFFLSYIIKGVPFVTLKIAQTIDGKIADVHGNSKWITNAKSRSMVHRLRAQYDAVLVGANTVNTDNPGLTVRHVKGRNPIRVVVSRTAQLNVRAKLFTDKHSKDTIVFSSAKSNRKNAPSVKSMFKRGINIIDSPVNSKNEIDLKFVLKKLGDMGISSILVEGGAHTFSSFLKQKMVDKIIWFISPNLIGQGLNAFNNMENITLRNKKSFNISYMMNLNGDAIVEAYIKK